MGRLGDGHGMRSTHGQSLAFRHAHVRQDSPLDRAHEIEVGHLAWSSAYEIGDWGREQCICPFEEKVKGSATSWSLMATRGGECISNVGKSVYRMGSSIHLSLPKKGRQAALLPYLLITPRITMLRSLVFLQKGPRPSWAVSPSSCAYVCCC